MQFLDLAGVKKFKQYVDENFTTAEEHENAELVTAAAINNLNDRLIDIEDSAASTTYVDTAVAGIVNSAPTTLDTLNELATALGNDPNFATTVATQIGQKVDTVKVGTTNYTPTNGVVSLPAYPTTLPASDVSAWAKASTKPTYTATEVGAISGVTFNGNNATVTNGVAAIVADVPMEVIEIIGDPDSITSVPAGTFARCGELVDENKSIILRFKYSANSNDAVDYILYTINCLGNSYSEFWFSDSTGCSSVGIFSNNSFEIDYNNYLRGVTFNGIAATVTNGVAAITASIPTLEALTTSEIDTIWNNAT